MNETKKYQQGVIVFGAIIFGICLFAAAINHFYFKTIRPSQSLSSAVNNRFLNSQKEFDQIRDKLLQNEKFNALQKVGSWPLRLEAMTYGKDKPFIDNNIVK